MAKIEWDAPGKHFFETGVKNCVLYVQDDDGEYPMGVAWNGITSISESPEGADANPMYADDTKYLNLRGIEEFNGTIEAYTFPKEFRQCNGESELLGGVVMGQQTRRAFGLCYRTAVGNEIQGSDYGYKLHLVYGCTCSPSERSYETINDSPEPINMSWEFETTPVKVTGAKDTSIITIDMTDPSITEAKKKAIEDALFGTDPTTVGGADGTDPYLPLPNALKALIEAAV